MPVIHRAQKKTEAESRLSEVIASELRLGRSDGPPDAPVIYEDEIPRTSFVHVTVVWPAWAGVSPESRSEAILDAYENVRGAGELARITLALGLTPEEAARFGFSTGGQD